jgi:hypothetical protein
VKRQVPLLAVLSAVVLAACGPPLPVLDVPPPEADVVPEEGPERQARPRMETPAERRPDTPFAAPPPTAALTPAEERFATLVLEPVTLTYDMVVEGAPIGASTVRLARAGADWLATQEIRLGPATQVAEVRFTGAMAPLGLAQRIEGVDVPLRTDLRVEGGRVLGTATGPGMEGAGAVDAPLARGAVLAGMERWILTGAELAHGRAVTIPVFDPERGATVDLTFRVVGLEEVTVPAGTFPAYRVEVAGADPASTLLVRARAPHVILRQEIAGEPVIFELRSLP